MPQNTVSKNVLLRDFAPVTSCFTIDNVVRVRVMVAGANSEGQNVMRQDDGNPLSLVKIYTT